MASLNWALLCDYAFLTDGKTGIIGIFEFIDIGSPPSIYPQLFLVVSTMLTPDDGELKIGAQISTHHGSIIGSLERPSIPAQKDISTHISLFGFYALPLPEAGEYHVEVLINGLSIHLIPLHVNLKP